MMDIHTFQDCLDLYGIDLGAWPADMRSEAHALLSRSAEAHTALKATQALEARLHATFGSRTASDALKQTLFAISATHAQHPAATAPDRRWIWALPWRLGASAAVVALLLGILSGTTGSLGQSEPQDIDMVAAVYGTDMALLEAETW